jgi:hypothetical protein
LIEKKKEDFHAKLNCTVETTFFFQEKERKKNNKKNE